LLAALILDMMATSDCRSDVDLGGTHAAAANPAPHPCIGLAMKRDPLELRDRQPRPGRNSLLRISDLEAVTANGLNYSRSSENQWSLAP
jgi:hypothetical protein